MWRGPAGKLFDMAMKGSCGATGIIRAQGTDIEPPVKNTEARPGEDDFSPEVSPYQKGVPAGVHKRDGKSVPRRLRRSVLAELVG